jgi:hypothetical protein
MMHEREKSDPCIVATKPANNPGQPGAESVERREGAEGNTGEPRTCRTPSRESVSQRLDRVRQAAVRVAVTYPRWEPGARIAPAGICAGGTGQPVSLPRSAVRFGSRAAYDQRQLYGTLRHDCWRTAVNGRYLEN